MNHRVRRVGGKKKDNLFLVFLPTFFPRPGFSFFPERGIFPRVGVTHTFSYGIQATTKNENLAKGVKSVLPRVKGCSGSMGNWKAAFILQNREFIRC